MPGSPGVKVTLSYRARGRGHNDGRDIWLEALALDFDDTATHIGPQGLLFQFRLLHQPMREPAQKIKVRTAALETARPKPHLVGEEKRHPALAFPRENEQRLCRRRRIEYWCHA